jgi:CRISPR-associated protein Cas2
MSMTVIVTRNVEERVRGFLASCALEIASGVYTAPRLPAGVRERIWDVLVKWGVGGRGDSATMTWSDSAAPGGQAVRTLGEPSRELVEADSLVLARRPLTHQEHGSLTTMLEEPPF